VKPKRETKYMALWAAFILVGALLAVFVRVVLLAPPWNAKIAAEFGRALLGRWPRDYNELNKTFDSCACNKGVLVSARRGIDDMKFHPLNEYQCKITVFYSFGPFNLSHTEMVRVSEGELKEDLKTVRLR
jgi:hypothetical protein